MFHIFNIILENSCKKVKIFLAVQEKGEEWLENRV